MNSVRINELNICGELEDYHVVIFNNLMHQMIILNVSQLSVGLFVNVRENVPVLHLINEYWMECKFKLSLEI